MSNILEISNLSKKYETFSLQDISFALEPGYIMGFVGPNGAGKTTTINLILHAIARDAGSIKVFGMDNITYEKQIKEKIGVVFDHPYLMQDWNMQDVEKAYKLFYRFWDSKQYYTYLERFGIPKYTQVKNLSRGMAVKLMLATALSHQAELLILDEPTSGLDPEARDELMEILQEYIEEGTRSILFSTHITSDLEKIADYITCMNQGKVYFTGTKDDLLERYRVVKGGPKDWKDNQDKIIGCRKFATGFEGLVLTEDIKVLKGELIIEQPAIDDIIIFTSRGGKQNER